MRARWGSLGDTTLPDLDLTGNAPPVGLQPGWGLPGGSTSGFLALAVIGLGVFFLMKGK